ncbi:N-acetylmuramic acid 6-phosphate etherase [Leisingera sp. S232]|uniref:N-acetylmuramic acid 6-phosphate etherase n=1 Tax=Leisingera sp. S232 TaxID=3415132 RepID=UPI003C7AEE49
MLPHTTEQLHPDAARLESSSLNEAALALAESQRQAAGAARYPLAAVCSGAEAMARSLALGGSLIYAAAGSSGLMAAADAMELGGTFGIAQDRIRILMAGGLPQSAHMPGGTEDDTDGLAQGLAGLTPDDTVIMVSASGSTPYTLEAARLARTAGAATIGIANNPGSALLALCDHAVLLETPPELISGSTRMGAGTAQKIALNMLSSLMAIKLGHVYRGMMVNLRADNAKLRARAETIVTRITGAAPAAARSALEQADGAVKPAVLICAGAPSLPRALQLLEDSAGQLGPALQQLPHTRM